MFSGNMPASADSGCRIWSSHQGRTLFRRHDLTCRSDPGEPIPWVTNIHIRLPKQAKVACISPRVRWDRSKVGQRKAVPAIDHWKGQIEKIDSAANRLSHSEISFTLLDMGCGAV